MTSRNTTFTFSAAVDLSEVEATLRLAILAVESLHGSVRVQLELDVHIDRAGRCVAVCTDTEVGRCLAVIFGGYVRREFGEDIVSVTAIPSRPAAAGGGK